MGWPSNMVGRAFDEDRPLPVDGASLWLARGLSDLVLRFLAGDLNN